MAESPVKFELQRNTLYPEYSVYWQGTRIGSVEKRPSAYTGGSSVYWRAYPYDGNGTYGDYATRREAASVLVARHLGPHTTEGKQS
jgi:hypothetical protein